MPYNSPLPNKKSFVRDTLPSKEITMSSTMIFGLLLVSFAIVYAKPATAGEKHTPTLPGNCPDFKPVASMDGLKLDGEWFGVHYVKSGFEMKDMKGTIKCVKKNVTPKPDGSFDSVLSAIKDGQQKSKTIHATPISGQPGKFTLKKDNPDASESNLSATGTLLAADDKYMVDSVCKSDGTNHGLLISVYSRQATLDAASLEKVKAVLNANNIKDELKPVEGC